MKPINATNIRVSIDGKIIRGTNKESIINNNGCLDIIIEGLILFDGYAFTVGSGNKDNVKLSVTDLINYFDEQKLVHIKYDKIWFFNKTIEAYCHKIEIILECERAAIYKMTFKKI
jgi:hypothetical protein